MIVIGLMLAIGFVGIVYATSLMNS